MGRVGGRRQAAKVCGMSRCPLCNRRVAKAARCPKDGWAAPVEPLAPLDAMEIPRIEGLVVGELLGVGGFGAVWEATLATSSAPLAIKVGRAATALVRARFDREAEALRRVGSPHAPRLVAA